MSIHMMNEQEQVDAIKYWWKKWGNVLLTIVVIIVVAIAAWQWWQRHSTGIKVKASQSYLLVLSSIAEKQPINTIAQAQLLIKTYPKSVYANLSAMILAKIYVQQNNLSLAAAQLKVVMQQNSYPQLSATARLRLAQVLVAQNNNTKALALLAKPAKAYVASYAMLRGDIYAKMSQDKRARTEYNVALGATTKKSPIYQLILLKRNNI